MKQITPSIMLAAVTPRVSLYPAAVGLKLTIYNGKDMFTRKIKPEMVGHKLGEFVQTRKKLHIPKQKKVVTISVFRHPIGLDKTGVPTHQAHGYTD